MVGKEFLSERERPLLWSPLLCDSASVSPPSHAGKQTLRPTLEDQSDHTGVREICDLQEPDIFHVGRNELQQGAVRTIPIARRWPKSGGPGPRAGRTYSLPIWPLLESRLQMREKLIGPLLHSPDNLLWRVVVSDHADKLLLPEELNVVSFPGAL